MTDINKNIIEEAKSYCENVKYVRKLDKYFCDLQRDFKALTSKLPVLLNRKLINKDDFLFDLEISMDDLAVQIQSAMFKVQQQDLLYNKGARGAEALVDDEQEDDDDFIVDDEGDEEEESEEEDDETDESDEEEVIKPQKRKKTSLANLLQLDDDDEDVICISDSDEEQTNKGKGKRPRRY